MAIFRDQGNTHHCSGSILDETHILTAAHCAFVKNEDDTRQNAMFIPGPGYFTVLAGKYDDVSEISRSCSLQSFFFV